MDTTRVYNSKRERQKVTRNDYALSHGNINQDDNLIDLKKNMNRVTVSLLSC